MSMTISHGTSCMASPLGSAVASEAVAIRFPLLCDATFSCTPTCRGTAPAPLSLRFRLAFAGLCLPLDPSRPPLQARAVTNTTASTVT
eukprot:6192757-Pleurochrysis_carterae.AAC.3